MSRNADAELREQRKQQICEATCRCLQNKAYASLTMRDVANEAKIATGLIHYYFSDKQTLMRETAAFVMEFYERIVFEELDLLGSSPLCIEALLGFFRHYHERIYSQQNNSYNYALFTFGTMAHFDEKISDMLFSWDYSQRVRERFAQLLPPNVDVEKFFLYLSSCMEGINVKVCMYGEDYKKLVAEHEKILSLVLPCFGIQ